MKKVLVSWLLRLYPPAWREEYGAELEGMLLARPFSPAIVFDVASSAVWQRIRAADVATYAGIGLMLVTIGAIAADIVEPQPYAWAPGQSTAERPPLSERVELLQRPLGSEFYVLVVAGIGFWTVLRGSRSPGRAAIRVSTIASLPLVLVGFLMLSGVLEYTELHPGQAAAPFDERGILYIFYKGFQQIPGPAPLVMVLSPLLRLPGAFMWGSIGGWLGRQFTNWWRRPVSA